MVATSHTATLRSDETGRWWCDGERVGSLEGCADIARTGVRSYRQLLEGDHADREVDAQGRPVRVGAAWHRGGAVQAG